MTVFPSWFYPDGPPNSIQEKDVVPGSFKLNQNYPNPFNPVTIINYQLQSSSDVKLTVYDVLGKEIETLINKKQSAGSYNITFNATGLASGIYYYRIEALSLDENFIQTRKMMILK
jgi:Tfp pilus assembly protein PilX